MSKKQICMVIHTIIIKFRPSILITWWIWSIKKLIKFFWGCIALSFIFSILQVSIYHIAFNKSFIKNFPVDSATDLPFQPSPLFLIYFIISWYNKSFLFSFFGNWKEGKESCVALEISSLNAFFPFCMGGW